MKVLVLAGTYPHAGHPFSGVFNEKCTLALRELCTDVQVIAPRPFVPPGLSIIPRWKSYAGISSFELRSGIPVWRPAAPVVPYIGQELWADFVPFLCVRRQAKRLHRRIKFDAIISFDLAQAGGIAWRLSRELGIPATGWAFGSDVRHAYSSPMGRVVKRALLHLDKVFYQSHELIEKAAALLSVPPEFLLKGSHVVLPHGIPQPPCLPRLEVRNRIRKEWGISEYSIVVLWTGRVFRTKGIFELLEAISLAAAQNTQIECVMVGSHSAYDETLSFSKKLAEIRDLKGRLHLLPASNPNKIWEHLCGADIFGFPSHTEGMPNSLLEAMAMGVPAIAFAIPAVQEIGGDALVAVPPLDSGEFSKAIVRLAASPDERSRLGKIGRSRVMNRFMVQKNMRKAVEHLAELVEK